LSIGIIFYSAYVVRKEARRLRDIQAASAAS